MLVDADRSRPAATAHGLTCLRPARPRHGRQRPRLRPRRAVAARRAGAAVGVGADVVAWDDPARQLGRASTSSSSARRGTTSSASRSSWPGSTPSPTLTSSPTRCRSCGGASTSTTSADLAAAGVPVVPTTFVEVGVALRAAGDRRVRAEAGGRRGQPRRRSLPRRRVDRRCCRDAPRPAASTREGRAVLLQPYLASVDTDGETPMVYIDGRFSHAAAKRVALPRARDLVPGLFARGGQPSARARRRHLGGWPTPPSPPSRPPSATRSTAASTSCGRRRASLRARARAGRAVAVPARRPTRGR